MAVHAAAARQLSARVWPLPPERPLRRERSGCRASSRARGTDCYHPGAMDALGRKAEIIDYVESYLFNSDKCFALFRP